MMMKLSIVGFLQVALTLSLLFPLEIVRAHTRFECPPPRSGNTGEKVGPCDAPDDLSLPAYPLKAGALNTITWLESIPHPGAPARLALSFDGDDSVESFESCLLLDHIPHDEYSVPVFGEPLTWHRSSITIWIPDVYCERCHLQLMTVMSDEVHGVPPDTTCAYAGALRTSRIRNSDLPACPVVYHSCSPVSINGTTPRNTITQCNTTEFEEKLDWPIKPCDSPQGHYDYSTYYYKGDPGLYNLSTSRLMMTGAPIKDCPSLQFCDPAVYFDIMTMVPDDAPYVAMEGTCAAMVGMEVEDFAMGVLPNTPRNMSAEDLIPTSGEADPCLMCEMVKPCFTDACDLRDPVSGNWTGDAEGCNQGAFCEFCFPDSPCFGFGNGDTSGNNSSDTDAAAADGDTTAASESDSAGQEEEEEEEEATAAPDDAAAREEEFSSGGISASKLPLVVGLLVMAVGVFL